MTNLSPLLERVIENVPDENKEEVVREFDKYEYEIQRMSEKEGKTGQATLTNKEIQKLNTTNQHGKEGLTVIQYQSLKAKAIENGVTDWTNKVDGTLTYRENLKLMER